MTWSSSPFGGVAGGGQLVDPAVHEIGGRGVPLGLAGVPGRGLAGLVGVVALGFDRGGDLGRTLGEQLARPLGHAGDTPMPQPPRRPVVGFDRVAELDGFGRRGHSPERGGGVQNVAQGGGVDGFPAPFAIGHAADIGDQNVIVGLRIARP